MDKLAKQLIELGHEKPELRRHLRPVLDKISADNRDPNVLFGDLRSAVSRNESGEIRDLLSKFYTYHRDYYRQRVLPYLKDILVAKLSKKRVGDTMRLHLYPSSATSPVKVQQVVVTQDMAKVRADYPDLSTLMFVKKTRGRKEGTISVIKDLLYYQATLRTQTVRILWID